MSVVDRSFPESAAPPTADRRPLPEEVSLLVEVADTSLEFDTTAKVALSPAELFLPG